MYDTFILRVEKQGRRTDTFTADWLTKWRLHGRTPNPPQIKIIPTKFDYLYRYNIESAYAPMRGTSEYPKTCKRRPYTALLTSIQASAGFHELRVQNLWPNIDCVRIWENLKDAPVPKNTRCVWYQVIHDIILTNVGYTVSIWYPRTPTGNVQRLILWNIDLLPVAKAEQYGSTRKPYL